MKEGGVIVGIFYLAIVILGIAKVFIYEILDMCFRNTTDTFAKLKNSPCQQLPTKYKIERYTLVLSTYICFSNAAFQEVRRVQRLDESGNARHFLENHGSTWPTAPELPVV